MLFDWLHNALSLRPKPAFPALLRVRNPSGKPVEQVHISGVFKPGDQLLEKTLTTANGLCMVEWPARARKLKISIVAGDSSAQIEVLDSRPDPDRVIEVQIA
jgi:hypothetical protein